MVPVKFTSPNNSCVPFSYLNLVDSSNTKRHKLIKSLGASYCGLRELSVAVRPIFGRGLSSPLGLKDVGLLVSKGTGLYLVVSSTHCVGVDCQRRYIFDSGEKFTLPLTIENLQHCGIHNIDEVREIL